MRRALLAVGISVLVSLPMTPGPAPAASLPDRAPALVAGAPSVEVVSLGGRTDATTSIAVNLALGWPAGADQVTVTNGDGAAATFPTTAELPWQLVPLPAQSVGATRTVTATYSGPGLAPITVSDSIVLDDRAPRLPKQRLYQNGRGWFLAASAEDAGSGVAVLAVLGGAGKPLQTFTWCAALPCATSVSVTHFFAKARPRQLRVTDVAGNAKVVHVARRATRCRTSRDEFAVFKPDGSHYDCVVPGRRCRPDDGHFWKQSAYVRCRQVHGEPKVVLRSGR